MEKDQEQEAGEPAKRKVGETWVIANEKNTCDFRIGPVDDRSNGVSR